MSDLVKHLKRVLAAAILSLAPVALGYFFILHTHDWNLLAPIIWSHVKVYRMSIALQTSIIYLILE